MKTIDKSAMHQININKLLQLIDPELASVVLTSLPHYQDIASNNRVAPPIINEMHPLRQRAEDEASRLYSLYKQIGYPFDRLKSDIKYCPYCGYGEVSDIEHIIPKNDYYEYFMFPLNLIPSCAICNRHKPKKYIVQGDEAAGTIHPYFDQINETRILHAELLVSDEHKLSVRYLISFPDNFIKDDKLKARIRNQFTKLHLARRFSSQAADEISEIMDELKGKDPNYCRFYLGKELSKKLGHPIKYSINHWEPTLYYYLLFWNGLDDYVGSL